MNKEKVITPISGYLMVLLVFVLLAIGLFGLMAIKVPWFALILGLALLLFPGFFFVNPNGSCVLVLFGKYIGTKKRMAFTG